MRRRAVAVLMLLLVPTAPALEIAVASSPAGPLQPEVETGEILLELTIDCKRVALRDPQRAGGPLIPVYITLVPENAEVTVAGALEHGLQCSSPDELLHMTIPYQVGVSSEAPGLTPLAIDIIARIDPHPADLAASEAHTRTWVEAAAISGVEMVRATDAVNIQAGEARFPVRFISTSNTPLILTFTLEEADSDSRAWLRPPLPARLAAASDQTPVDVEFVVDVPAKDQNTATLHAYRLRVDHVAPDGSIVGHHLLTLMVRHHGPDEPNAIGERLERAVPGPGLVVVLAALAVVAVSARRGRKSIDLGRASTTSPEGLT